MGRKFKSAAFEAIHGAVQGMHRAGTVSKETMREFDETCLTTHVEAVFREAVHEIGPGRTPTPVREVEP